MLADVPNEIGAVDEAVPPNGLIPTFGDGAEPNVLGAGEPNELLLPNPPDV